MSSLDARKTTAMDISDTKQRKRGKLSPFLGLRRRKSVDMNKIEKHNLPPPISIHADENSPTSVVTAKSATIDCNATISLLKSEHHKHRRKRSNGSGGIRGLLSVKLKGHNNGRDGSKEYNEGLFEQLCLETSSELFQRQKEDIEFQYRVRDNFLVAFL